MKKEELKSVIDNIKSGRWGYPVNRFSLSEGFSGSNVDFWLEFLQQYEKQQFTKEQLLHSLKNMQNCLGQAKDNKQDKVELVWTGPEAPNSTLRDTGVVAQELFRKAEKEVIVVGFAFYQGKDLFKEIAQKLDNDDDFDVRFFVDIRREGSTAPDAEILIKFKRDFKKKQWPGEKLPTIYYDPRTLELETDKKSSMHAKCIIVDSSNSLVTSANFTQAAHHRNIEAGTLIESKNIAKNLRSQFLNLVETGVMKKI